MSERSGAKIVMEGLVRQGVDTIFGYPGGVVLPLYDEMLNWPQVKHVLVRHEQCAAHMADGYARSTGKVGVCLATSGPGATNLVTGIATAMMDSIPMVALTGNVNSWAIGTDAFQETDIQGITIPITKHNYLVKDVADLPHVMEEAFYLANTGRKGPVLVDIPKDVFIAKTANPFPDVVVRRGYVPSAPLNPQSFERAAKLLAEAKRPIVIAGAGVIWSGASESLRELAAKCDLPIISTLLGLGNIDRHDSRSLGMMGMHGEYVGTKAVQEADLLIGIGMRFDDRITGKVAEFAKHAKIVHFDIDHSEFSKIMTTEVIVPGDLAESLPAFVNAVQPKNNPEWWSQVSAWRDANPIVVPNDTRFLARHVLQGLNAHTKANAIVSTDVGQHQMWTSQLYKFKRPYQWLSSGGLGTMGFGFPSAMGAAFANPDSEVWAVVGDGGFQMTLQELQTAVEHQLDVKICLINNGFLGMVRQWQELFYDNRYSHVSMGSPDYGKLADAYGVSFFRCSSRAELDATFEKARNTKGPVLVEFLVEMEENVFPMVPAGASNDLVMRDPALVEPAKEEVKA
ncbi:MAG: acetolactate synthase, large subunit, biosynthetic type [Armatimonadetes bacterium Cent15-Ar3]|nr:MAG: acetolactate synthase, large subunit, biosynthetic type [Armatimonadetes bacterium Cent15-Ar3]